MNEKEVLKAQIIDFVLKFLQDRGREVRISDLQENIRCQFEAQIENQCKDVPGSDSMFVDSVINELTDVYEFAYRPERGRTIGLKPIGNEVLAHGGCSQYQRFQKEKQEQKENQERQKEVEEAKERKWNIRNNIIQLSLGVITIISMIAGFILSGLERGIFPMLTFIAGILLGYGLNNRRKNRHRYKYTPNL